MFNLVDVFLLFHYNLHGSSFGEIRGSFNQNCFVPNLVEIRSVVLEDFFNMFSQFYNNLPLEKSVALVLNKIESPLTKDALCPFTFCMY